MTCCASPATRHRVRRLAQTMNLRPKMWRRSKPWLLGIAHSTDGNGRNERAGQPGDAAKRDRATPRKNMSTLHRTNRTTYDDAVKAERGLLSILLCDSTQFAGVADLGLTAEHFADFAHEAVFQALHALHESGALAAGGAVCEPDAVCAKLGALGLAARLNDRGGAQYLRELQAEATPLSLSDYVSTIRLAHSDRQIRKVEERIAQAKADGQERAVLAAQRQTLQDEQTTILLMAQGWADPQPLPDAAAAPPWPDDALPASIGDFVDAVAASVQVPRDLAGMVALGLMSACWAGKVRAWPCGDYRESLCIYAVGAADVGERKSATYAALEAPLLIYQQERQQELAPQWSDYEAQRRLLEARLTRATQAGGSDDDNEGDAVRAVSALRRKLDALQRPPRAEFLTQDTTAEGLARLMSETGGHVCLMSPEGGGIFDQLVGRYDKTPNLDVYLKAYDGERIAVTRSNREREYPAIEQPALVMAVTTQPATLRRLTARPELRERGLLARMLFAVPSRSLVGFRTPIGPTIPPAVRDAYLALIGWALRMPRPDMPHDLAFHPATLAAYEALATRIETQLRPDGALRDLAGWGNKLTGKIVRLAALFHLMSRPGDREPWRIPVSLEAFQRAARLADYLIAHARRAFGLMHESRELRAARKLMAQLASDRCRRFTTRDAHRIIARNETVETARSTLDLLAAHHQIARIAGRRHDSEAWVVHPAIIRQWERTPASPHAIQAGTDGTLA